MPNEVSNRVMAAGAAIGMSYLNVVVDGESDASAVRLIAAFIPRTGERLILLDGTRAEVARVIHRTYRSETDAEIIIMVPNVVVRRVEK